MEKNITVVNTLTIIFLCVMGCMGMKEPSEQGGDGKLLSIFNVVTFPNTFCTGSGNRNGTCYTSDECESRGGTGSGSCASGYGVCCIISLSCGGTSSDNCTYIEQTAFTTSSSLASNPCTYTICPNSNMICRIRLDFTSFMIASPFTTMVSTTPEDTAKTEGGAAGDCATDTFTFSSPGNQGSPVICGFNTGQHMILDASSACNVLNFNIGASSTTSRSWTIKATQFTCGDHDSQGGPPGCLQYYTGSSGNIASYNYPTSATAAPTDSSHLSNQCYTICFRQEATKCSICYGSAIAAGDMFGISLSPDAAAQSGVDSDCTEDYLQIPFGVANAQTITNSATTTTKFCGRFLNPARGETAEASVCSFSIPFRVTFKTDSDEICTDTAGGNTCEAAKVPGGTIGFFLKFAQIAC
eukprot:TRINITY_DN1875_c0_g1_i1.p1 TRINITY_DN1875_c0_g1~~TRINITY_DN1875_c0_g1_i1.p1  ORF type:complete len:412 (-),score=19.94 TRINITY_DN1875_c0_g1_i1:127-1362(-)